VTVPGAVDAWSELSRRFGRLPFADLFEPAVEYARNGFLVSPVVAEQWEMVAGLFSRSPDFAQAFLSNGRAPKAGERFSLPPLAATLEEIAATHGEAFYRGALAERIGACATAAGAALRADDLGAHHGEWVEPIATAYRGYTIHEIGPSTQGIAALMALAILEHFERISFETDAAQWLHLQIEATKLALADARRFVGDPAVVDVPVAWLLDRNRIAERAKLVARSSARPLEPRASGAGDTVYLATADGDGMTVSYIQSNYFSFGSGVVVPGTGIALQNRGACFTLEHGHPNCVGPSRRPFHTIIPATLARDGRAVMSFGVMGGPMQPQGHVQVLAHVLDGALNPQAAIDAPRWQVFDGLRVGVEPGFSAGTLDGLRERGHEISEMSPAVFGGAQAIWRLDGGWLGASDWRKDGMAAGF
jgi:gamma-glutamyltranspeptidase/glutathione hydrolase